MRSVTANTREGGRSFLDLAVAAPLHTKTREFPLTQANEADQALKEGRIDGAVVLRVC